MEASEPWTALTLGDPRAVEVEIAIRLVSGRAAPSIVVAGLVGPGRVASLLAVNAATHGVRLEVLDADGPSGAIRVTLAA